ncbi:Lipopolysaccharide export system ATP-binding protein LptB [subsurface metagenome]
MALLELREVTKRFGGLVAVDNVDLDIEEGEIRAIIGPNGAGKTTLFNLITGNYPVTEGRIKYNGKDITGLSPHEIASRGLVRTFQQTALFDEFTLLQNVGVACHLHAKVTLFGAVAHTPVARQTQRQAEEMALELLEFMGLADLKDELAINLPHGHQRLLGVAIGLAAKPKMLLLDEPVTGMNPTEKQDMVDRVRHIRDQGITIVIVEHDMKTVMGVCEKISVLDFGKKIAEGPPEEILRNQQVIEAYLGAGETAA